VSNGSVLPRMARDTYSWGALEAEAVVEPVRPRVWTATEPKERAGDLRRAGVPLRRLPAMDGGAYSAHGTGARTIKVTGTAAVVGSSTVRHESIWGSGDRVVAVVLVMRMECACYK
jgi:hypothetical protein